MDPVLSSIEAITQRCLSTLTALVTTATTDAADLNTDSYFHTLEASFLALHTACFIYLVSKFVWLNIHFFNVRNGDTFLLELG